MKTDIKTILPLKIFHVSLDGPPTTHHDIQEVTVQHDQDVMKDRA